MATKNTIKKSHSDNRTASKAKAGKRAGTPKAPEMQVHMGKVRFIARAVIEAKVPLSDAAKKVNANEVTVAKAEEIINKFQRRWIVDPAKLVMATQIAKAKMAKWS